LMRFWSYNFVGSQPLRACQILRSLAMGRRLALSEVTLW
jgi:hypothetical protein